MSKKLLTIFLAVVAFSATASAATAIELPCFLSQVQVASRPEPTQVSGGPLYQVVVTGMLSYHSDCRNTKYDSANGSITFRPVFVVERRDVQSGTYEAIRSFAPVVPMDGSGRSRRAPVFETLLSRGSYRVHAFDGERLLESIPFAAGSTVGDFALALPFAKPIPQDDRLALAYGQPSAIVRSGVVYFRSLIPDGKVASGYLFQDQSDGTTSVVSAQFEQLDSSDSGFTALPQVVGGITDLAWTRVNLSSSQLGLGTFDAGLPITGCVKSSGGNTCFQIFDPMVPFKDFNPNGMPFGGAAVTLDTVALVR